MDIADELEKLHKLHEDGVITDDEWERAKEAVLKGNAAAAASEAPEPGLVESIFGSEDRTLGQAANRYVSFQIVMGVIGLLLFGVVACTILSNRGAIFFR